MANTTNVMLSYRRVWPTLLVGALLVLLNTTPFTLPAFAEYDAETLKRAILKLHERYEASVRENAQLKQQISTLQNQAISRPVMTPAVSNSPMASADLTRELQQLKAKLAQAETQRQQAMQQSTQATLWETEAQSLRQQLAQLKQVIADSESTQRNLESQLKAALAQRGNMAKSQQPTDLVDTEINGLRERIAQLKAENQTMRSQLTQGAGLDDAALKNRLTLATNELKKAAQTIQDQNSQIASLSERIEALQSLQMEGPITLTGQDSSSQGEPTQQQKIDRLKGKLNTSSSTVGLSGAAAPISLASTVEQSNTALTETLRVASNLRKSGEWQKAQALLLQALQTHGEDARIHYNLGNVYAGQQEWAKAKTAYEKSIVLDATFAQAYYNAGIAAQQLGERASMKQHLGQFLKLEPTSPHRSTIEAMLKG
jgi:tetratricopeptide (TPR) repeat protein